MSSLTVEESVLPWSLRIGANAVSGGVRFRTWAPTAARVELMIMGETGRALRMHAESGGYHSIQAPRVHAGCRYKFRVDGQDYPDPASRSQPDGVHGASEVVDPTTYAWNDAGWSGLSRDGLVIYELHIGTFTRVGTFDAAMEHLDHIADLGATAIQVMPIATWSGRHNWGYDGALVFAPSATYGGPEAFRRFVDAAHGRGLGVILDVVYNHFGPDGNYLHGVTGGRFFTDRYKTPWGDAIRYDGPDSAAVRDFIRQNALHWAHEYHVDGLRLDATHAIIDDSPVHLVAEIAADLHALNPPRLLIAEDERNDRRLIAEGNGGFGLDGVWADDFHHSVRRLAAGDSEGYFESYAGTIDELVTTLKKGWLFEGQHAKHQDAARGTPAFGLPAPAFVHCIQNHDQVGNRPFGDRLGHVIPDALYRAMSALLLLSPYTPMLWMGQEWNASTPFQFFTDFPEELGRLITEGRRKEFRHFSAFADDSKRRDIPDPQDPQTFARSKLRWTELREAGHASVLELYKELLRLRRCEPALRECRRGSFVVAALDENSLALRRSAANSDTLLLVVNVRGEACHELQTRQITLPPSGATWSVILSTDEARFGGADSAHPLNREGTALRIEGPRAVLLRARMDIAAI